jgi:hypothetical protein
VAGFPADPVAFGEEFSLHNGETATVGKNDLLLVRFDQVTSDARCSIGSTCPQDGDAIVIVIVRQARDEPASLELHTQAGLTAEATYRQYHVKLVRLEPRPVGEQSVPLQQYVATLTVSKT